MFNSVMIDVALGMVFIFLLLSFVVAALREAIEARLKSRSKFLAYGIRQIFDDPRRAEQFFDHPAVRALYGGNLDDKDKKYFHYNPQTNWWSWFPALLGTFSGTVKLPSYLPSRTFALTVIQMINTGRLFVEQPSGDAAVANDNAAVPEGVNPDLSTIQILRRKLKQHEGNDFSHALSAVLTDAGDDLNKSIASLEKWYDASMDRVSGWYKRETQRIMPVLGLIVSVALNVDALVLIKHLSSDENDRERIAGFAIAATTDQAMIKKVNDERLKLEQHIEETREKIKNAAAGGARQGAPAAQNGATAAGALRPADESGLVDQQAPPQPSSGSDTKVPPVNSTPEQNLKNLADEERKGQENLAAKIAEADELVNKEVRRLNDLNLPIGWTRARWNGLDLSELQTWMTFLGWILTAFGLSFGAPFWFDVLNRIMVIRSTVKPHEKSPEESSQDG